MNKGPPCEAFILFGNEERRSYKQGTIATTSDNGSSAWPGVLLVIQGKPASVVQWQILGIPVWLRCIDHLIESQEKNGDAPTWSVDIV